MARTNEVRIKPVQVADFVANLETRIIEPLEVLAYLLTHCHDLGYAVPDFNILSGLGQLVSAVLERYEQLKGELGGDLEAE